MTGGGACVFGGLPGAAPDFSGGFQVGRTRLTADRILSPQPDISFNRGHHDPLMTWHFRAAVLAATTTLTLLAVVPHFPSAALLDGQAATAASLSGRVERCAIHDDPFFFDTCLASQLSSKTV